MADENVNQDRRRFLTGVTTGVGAAGVAAAAVPFVASMTPSAKAKAAGAPVQVDIGNLEPGRLLKFEWRGKPVWIIKRTPEMLESLNIVTDELVDPDSDRDQQPEYAQNQARSINPEVLVLVGLCTHLGCSPLEKLIPGELDSEWQGGFFCPCHGSKFDLAGRVYKGVPAPTNLVVPPHRFLTDTRVEIGVDQTTEEMA